MILPPAGADPSPIGRTGASGCGHKPDASILPPSRSLWPPGVAMTRWSLMLMLGGTLALPHAAAAEVTLAPHKAVYALKLLETGGKQTTRSVRGRIFYDFSG